jgi:hypothetical protein
VDPLRSRKVVVLDFEATCLVSVGIRSYPIEVVIGDPDTGDVQSWLIKPEREWLDSWDWSEDSEWIHGLTRQHLLAHGHPRAQVAREVLAVIGDREPLSDNPAFEQYWLWVLNGSAFPSLRVGHLGDLLEYIAAGDIEALEAAHAHARKVAPKTHRAGDDVRHYLVVMQELLRSHGPT